MEYISIKFLHNTAMVFSTFLDIKNESGGPTFTTSAPNKSLGT